MYIGDSISGGTHPKIKSLSENKFLIDAFCTSKAVDNFFFIPALKNFAAQEIPPKFVLFNNGLHGWHLEENQYNMHYEKMLVFLSEQFPNAVLIPVLTTDILSPEEQRETIVNRNEIVTELAIKYKLASINLYAVSQKNAALHIEDGVHFKDEGYELLANEILKNLER